MSHQTFVYLEVVLGATGQNNCSEYLNPISHYNDSGIHIYKIILYGERRESSKAGGDLFLSKMWRISVMLLSVVLPHQHLTPETSDVFLDSILKNTQACNANSR